MTEKKRKIVNMKRIWTSDFSGSFQGVRDLLTALEETYMNMEVQGIKVDKIYFDSERDDVITLMGEGFESDDAYNKRTRSAAKRKETREKNAADKLAKQLKKDERALEVAKTLLEENGYEVVEKQDDNS